MSDPLEIPLFPLNNVVLFPDQLLPLHIFEERYKLMIGECLRDKRSFGVLLIKSGREVGAPAVPFTVGTTARIAGVQALDQGRMDLKTIGERPFRLLRTTQLRPYMRGEVELLDYGLGETAGLDPLVASVREQFSVHLDILAQLSQRDRVDLDLNLDAERLSYLVASILAVQNLEKQRLLETPRADERLQKELSLLMRENRTLQTFLYLRKQSGGQPPEEGQLGRRISPN
jgi:Lon protease-like protein